MLLAPYLICFRLPGVASMSADTRKCGYAAKGTDRPARVSWSYWKWRKSWPQ